jgi:uncharacterized protein (DUF2344 family)
MLKHKITEFILKFYNLQKLRGLNRKISRPKMPAQFGFGFQPTRPLMGLICLAAHKGLSG